MQKADEILRSAMDELTRTTDLVKVFSDLAEAISDAEAEKKERTRKDMERLRAAGRAEERTRMRRSNRQYQRLARCAQHRRW